MERKKMDQKRLLKVLLVLVSIVFVWSLIGARDYGVWLLESGPVLIGFPILFFSYKKFKFTNLTYTLIAVHACILMVGGKYSYAQNPLFEWIKVTFHLSRNYYDRVGHFFQGFVPVLMTREFLLKKSSLKRGKLLFFLCMSVVFLITASYELIEWGSVLTLPPAQGLAFLGSQGDIWDAQKDMLMAVIGGLVGLIFFTKVQDKQLKAQRGL